MVKQTFSFPSPSGEIVVVLLATNSHGAPEFVAVRVQASEEDINLGRHYDRARELAYDKQYEEPIMPMDEVELPGFLKEALENGQIPVLTEV